MKRKFIREDSYMASISKIFRVLFLITLVSTNLALANNQEGSSEPLTAQSVWKSLRAGNRKFVDNPKYAKQRKTLVNQQNPPAVILSCSDSRVPAEIVFSQGLGKVFSVRVAGNIVDDVVVDSVEYTVTHHDTPLILVLGHEGCGAVDGALNRLRRNNGVIDVQQGHLRAVLIPIEKAIVAAGINIFAPDAFEQSIKANIFYQANQLIVQSPIIAEQIALGKVQIIGAEYSLKTGKVKQLFSIP